MTSGNKYHRIVEDITADKRVTVDVYAVLEAFDVRCPARQHAIKKLLCTGIRGKGDSLQDLRESRDSIDRAIELERRRIEIRGAGGEVPTQMQVPQGGISIASQKTESPIILEMMCSKCHNKMRYVAGEMSTDICDQCRKEDAI